MNRVTLELAKGRVMYVRCHISDVIPGEYKEAFALEEIEPGVWEAKIAMERLSLSERRDFEESALATGQIKKVVWKRCNGTEIKFREKERRRHAHIP